ncbi:aconitate hydratase AcnA [Saccharibacter sp. 17.LH.SD]|uniref:aconitate hydratase AcnA n=1 Tax=Saccharibacter sp. 17.LH.SD TaxID=2689393 RepID=UPI00136CA2DB|nr:aconitate hydratase AcnA [Saccharibacter sp. 17.LH.SD]MXV43797.1 aconitate hydratase AcnA [Saccharibacter sp. 17.LH.SD]
MTHEKISSFWRTLSCAGHDYRYVSLDAVSEGLGDVSRLPVSLKILLENVLRHGGDGAGFVEWLKEGRSQREIPFSPSRILMQDFTGVPAVVDLAAMRDGIIALGANPEKVNPQVPVDLVIDHSVQVDVSAEDDALSLNMKREFERNRERYAFLRWGQEAFKQFRVVPPGAGICHQVNLEYLAPVVCQTKDDKGDIIVYPDTVFGTDSHTTMINGLGVLGWGVGGIEAEAAMLGQAGKMLIPDVVGVRLEGQLVEGTTATDLVLTITQRLRAKGVVGRFVEFYGPALEHLPVADRATIANMAPEYGATVGFFPVDRLTTDYLYQTGRSKEHIALVEAYHRQQGTWHEPGQMPPHFTDHLTINLSDVVPSLAGPRRPQDRIALGDVSGAFRHFLEETSQNLPKRGRDLPVSGQSYRLKDGAVVIAAITSCTSTSNPEVLLAAGLLARKARALGLKPKPWVKTSLAPGSRVVTDYLERAGLDADLNALGFQTVGYGCTTCIGNSGPLKDEICEAIEQNDLVAVSVLSGNRNFEGRISPQVRANYLASPPLVVAYALLGTVDQDITTSVLGHDPQGKPIKLSDLWPSRAEISDLLGSSLSRDTFIDRYRDVTLGTEAWQKLPVAKGSATYPWNDQSTYIQNPPYFEELTSKKVFLDDISQARILALLGDNITTDHISPAGAIGLETPAGVYLRQHGVAVQDFNSYGARRGNDRVMMRGTFANIRLKNEMAPGTEGGVTRFYPGGDEMTIFDAAERYRMSLVPLVVIGGKEYGMGSSRDWAAKGTRLLGVRAVIAESFERIHRSNLVGMGVLPLVFPEGVTRHTLGLKGDELLSLEGLKDLVPRGTVRVTITSSDGSQQTVEVLCRVDTVDELLYVKKGGILPYVLCGMAKTA